VHDKVVRRRRAALAALVALSLVLLTAYFGESAGGGLHAVQRGAMEVLAPIQEGADRALKPFRDLTRWFGDTLDAKDERDRLRAQRDQLLAEVARLEDARRENAELRDLVDLSERTSLDALSPVTARVYERSRTTWWSRVKINKGASDGLKTGQPVVGPGGLAGRVATVSDGNAVVTLITDQLFSISALAGQAGEPGVIEQPIGEPGQLRLDLVDRPRRIREGDRIVTAGTTSEALPSLFPRGIVIGTVRRIEGDGELDRIITVTPAADLGRLDVVRVLTAPSDDLRAAR
jgi:rod shape-determining protein MreC